MIKLLGSVPNKVVIAVSGGQDSMAALDFLANNSRRKVVALHFNHETKHGAEADSFVKSYCKSRDIPLATGLIRRRMESGESKEAYWREERYGFFDNWLRQGTLNSTAQQMMTNGTLAEYTKAPIVTCHHLDDAAETWIFTALHGQHRLIPYKRDNFIRPFLTTRRQDLAEWSEGKSVPFIFDPSNDDTSYMRCFIRHTLMPKALVVNPGLHKVIKKRLLREYDNNVDNI